jgi:hypothetical protein
MGLTIHYKLIVPAGTNRMRAREIVVQLRRRTQSLKYHGRLDCVGALADDAKSLHWARQWVFRTDMTCASRFSEAEVLPLEGCIFVVDYGCCRRASSGESSLSEMERF